MSLIKITHVEHIKNKHPELYGYAIDLPKTEFDDYFLEIRGWILGRHQAVQKLQMLDVSGRVMGNIEVNLQRPDVAELYSHEKAAATCGFLGVINVLGLSVPNARVQVVAEMSDASRIPLAYLNVERKPIQLDDNALLQPLIINSIGRTGTTWLMKLFIEHERVATYSNYPYEARIASYWLHSLLKIHDVLPQHRNPLHNTNRDWINGEMTQYSPLGNWFKRQYQEHLATFCRHSIEQAYLQVAQEQGKNLTQMTSENFQPVYFAEKFGPGYLPDLLWDLYPNTREIMLVRDFRDMYCSILKFTEKPAMKNDFGRNAQLSEVEFVKKTAERIKQLVEAWRRRQDRIYLLRYEDLILDPERTLSKLLAHLGLDNSSEKIQQWLERASVDSNNENLRQHRTSNSVKASIGRWQTDLDNTQQALVNEYFTEYLKLFDYA